MKVIITKRFEKIYLKHLYKYLNTQDFSQILKKKNHTFISLHFPYYKFKLKIQQVDFRGIIVFVWVDTLIPVILFLKKDKKNWENIYWNEYENLILEEYEKAISDIENWDFQVL